MWISTIYSNVLIAASSYGQYWTQNFASGTHGISNPIVVASHIQFTAGQLTFLVNYYHMYDLTNGKKLKSMDVYLDDKGYTMTLPSTNQFNDVSTSGMGTYEFTIAANTTASNGCRKYYFKAVDNAGYTYYYPSYGYLLTQGENSACKNHYLAQAKSSDVIIPVNPIVSDKGGVNRANSTVGSDASTIFVAGTSYVQSALWISLILVMCGINLL